MFIHHSIQIIITDPSARFSGRTGERVSKPVHVSLAAELREALFQLGMVQNRCVALSSENYEMNERNKLLDQDNQMLRKQVAELQTEIGIDGVRADMASGE